MMCMSSESDVTTRGKSTDPAKDVGTLVLGYFPFPPIYLLRPRGVLGGLLERKYIGLFVPVPGLNSIDLSMWARSKIARYLGYGPLAGR